MEQVYYIHGIMKHFRKPCISPHIQSFRNLKIEILLEEISKKDKKIAVFVLTKKQAQCCPVVYIIFYLALLLPRMHHKVHYRTVGAQVSSV